MKDDEYSDKETERCREAALKKMLAIPPRPDIKAKKNPSPAKRKAKKRA